MTIKSLYWRVTFLVLVMMMGGLPRLAIAQVQPPWPGIPVVSVQLKDRTATEQSPLVDALPDTALMVIRRSGTLSEPLTVYYQVGGTAEAGVDYETLPGVAEFAAGAQEVELVVVALDDELLEPEETVLVQLVVPPGLEGVPPLYWLGTPAEASAVIRDNEPQPNAAPKVAIVTPPNGAVFARPERLWLVAGATDADGWVVSVEFFADGESLGVVRRDLIWGPLPMDDGRPEWGPYGGFHLVWDRPSAGVHRLWAVAVDDQGASTTSEVVEIQLLEGMAEPIVTVVASDPEGAEVAEDPVAETPGNPAVFTLYRTGSTEQALEVAFRLSGGAVNGVDYAAVPLTATIPEGAESVEVVVRPLDDDQVEGPETVVLGLAGPAVVEDFPPGRWGHLLGRARTAVAVIRDNDQPEDLPPWVRLRQPVDGEVFAAGAVVRLVAVAADGTGEGVTVEFFEGATSLGIGHSAGDGEQAYTLDWPAAAAGDYVLTAVATDDGGASARSAPVRIRVVSVERPSIVTVAAVDPEAGENPDDGTIPPNPAVFAVHRTGDVAEGLTVRYQLGGSAENGVDYAKLPLEVTVPPGAASVQIEVTVLDDALAEGPETVVLQLLPACCTSEPVDTGSYLVGSASRARAVILDDESPANLPPRVAITEPRSGQILPPSAILEIAGVARDVDGYVWKMEFFAGDDKIGERVLNFLIPPPPGEDQHFSMNWEGVSPGTYLLRARATDDRGAASWSGPVKVLVRADDVQLPPLVTVVAADPLALEPDAEHAADAAVFVVHRTGDLALPLTVYYALRGSAENGADYEPLAGEVVLPAGRARATVLVQPLEDEAVEGPETVVLELQPIACIAIYPPDPACYVLGDLSRAEARIQERQPEWNRSPRVELVRPNPGDVFQVPEPIRLVAMAGDPDGRVVKVAFYAGGEWLGEQLAPEPELTAADVGQRAFTFVWENPPVGRHVLQAVATDDRGAVGESSVVPVGVLEDWQPPVVRIVAADPHAAERPEVLPLNTARFKVHRTGRLDRDVVVFYSLHGSAGNGQDYVELPGNVVIPAGRRHADIVVVPINDTEPERMETVVVSLEPSPAAGPLAAYEVGTPARAVAVIVDNDEPTPEPTPEIQMLAEDVFHLSVRAETGQPFRIEASDDLTHWMPVADQVSEEGRVHFDQPGTRGLRHQFYRVRPITMEALDLVD